MRATLARMRDYFWTQGARDNFVGGLVLAGLLAAIPAAWYWSKSGFSLSIKAALIVAKSALLAVSNWLASPIGVPQGIVWLILLTAAGTGAYVALPLTRRLIAGIKPQYGAIVDPAELQILRASAKKLVQLQEAVVSETGSAAMRVLFRMYPHGVSLAQFCEIQLLSFAAVERMCEELERAEYVVITGVGSGHSKSVRLTKSGRDYCLNAGFDLLE
jgi:hypothetical protein